MLQLSQTGLKTTNQLHKKIIETLEFYGFKPANEILQKGTHTPIQPIREVETALSQEKFIMQSIKKVLNKKAHINPSASLVYDTHIRSGKVNMELHAFGTERATAEITLIATIDSILKRLQIKNYIMHINSLGNKESKIRFVRDLQAYLRDVKDDLPAYAKNQIQKKNPISALVFLLKKNHPLAHGAPNSIDYLTDEGRIHLRQILEFMEFANIGYELDTSIIGSQDFWSHTIFETRIPNNDNTYVPIALGGRYNAFARRAYNKRFKGAGVVIEFELKGAKPNNTSQNTSKKPAFFITYIGDYARMQMFVTLDALHKAGISVQKTVANDSLISQMKEASKASTPYIIIIGHKEALENSAIVRNVETRTQKVIPLSKLPSYLKRLKIN